ncbi:MAG: DUF3000 family protein [Microbacteriaceae bacterium]|nr:DUF3000 family protein [Microbacteriaceae bacterium]
MVEIQEQENVAPEFALAMNSLREALMREEILVTEIEAPGGLAAHSVAFNCDVKASNEFQKIDLGTGRFVLLWDEEPQESWGSRFRVIIFAKSPLETDIGSEESSTGITWTWLKESLEYLDAGYSAEAGTTTRVISRGFGALSNQADHAELELRASWSPNDSNVGAHLMAWQNLICMMSGFPLHNEGLGRLDVRH